MNTRSCVSRVDSPGATDGPVTYRSIVINISVRISGPDLCKIMRQHRVTIAELERRTGITIVAIRRRRETGLTDAYAIRDWLQAITGNDPGPALDHPAVEMVEF